MKYKIKNVPVEFYISVFIYIYLRQYKVNPSKSTVSLPKRNKELSLSNNNNTIYLNQ